MKNKFIFPFLTLFLIVLLGICSWEYNLERDETKACMEIQSLQTEIQAYANDLTEALKSEMLYELVDAEYLSAERKRAISQIEKVANTQLTMFQASMETLLTLLQDKNFDPNKILISIADAHALCLTRHQYFTPVITISLKPEPNVGQRHLVDPLKMEILKKQAAEAAATLERDRTTLCTSKKNLEKSNALVQYLQTRCAVGIKTTLSSAKRKSACIKSQLEGSTKIQLEDQQQYQTNKMAFLKKWGNSRLNESECFNHELSSE